jgi:predicted permease
MKAQQRFASIIDGWWQDARFGLRLFRSNTAFTAAAALTLALGIGANTAVFSLFAAIVLKPLPVRDPATLTLFSTDVSETTRTSNRLPGGQWTLFSNESYEFLREQPLPFDALAAVQSGQITAGLRVDGAGARQVERATVQLVSGNYFDVMGVEPASGRALTDGDSLAGAPPAAVVSHRFWVERLDAKPAAGTTVRLDDTAFTIVGVMPETFFGERVRRAPDVWIPLVFQPQIERRPSRLTRSDTYWLSLIARLRPGTALATAETATTEALRQFLVHKMGSKLTEEQQRRVRSARVELATGMRGVSTLRQRYADPLLMLLGVVAVVLLIACANIANLLLAQARVRQPELAARAALGASRPRLALQLLSESALLGLLGAIGGLLVAQWTMDAALVLIEAETAPLDASLDSTAMAFTVGLTLVTVLAFGVAPALLASRVDLATVLKPALAQPRRRLGPTESLVALQIAFSVALVVASALLARSVWALLNEHVGFTTEQVVLVRVHPRLAGYDPDGVGNLYRQLRERLGAVRGVESVTIARYSPFSGSRSLNRGVIEGYTPSPDEEVALETVLVGPAYASTMGMSLVAGRELAVTDAADGRRVGVVNEAFVRRYLAGHNPIGRRFSVTAPRPDTEIVGVIRDAKFHDIRAAVEPMVFVPPLPLLGQATLDAELAVRTSARVEATAGQILGAIREVNAMLPIDDPKPLRTQVADSFRTERILASLVGALSVLALILASIGVYGTVSQSVLRRMKEIGLRLAIGSTRQQVLWMITRDTGRVLLSGIALGVPATIFAASFLSSLLFGVDATDPLSVAAGVAVLIAFTLAAALVPAYRAAGIDPMLVLRRE